MIFPRQAPTVAIDLQEFWRDPYPMLARLRAEAPIAYVPELASTLLTRHEDIMICEKQIEIFSSDQPAGLMTRLMGHNMMRKDGPAHSAERKVILPAMSPKTVMQIWTAAFQVHADRILDALAPQGSAELCRDFALPLSGECLKELTGLTNITYQEIDAWSQAMIDGIANYGGDLQVERRCRDATAAIDRAIDDMVPVIERYPNASLLSVMLAAGMGRDSVHANIKLAISGGQNEPRDAIAGTIWALLTHPEQLALVRAGKVSWLQAFEEYARWISPIGMSPRRIAKPWRFKGVDFAPEDRVFFMFGSANRDERVFAQADRFDVTRDIAKSVAFGAGPHFCAGAWASRAMIADVALPAVFARLGGLRLAAGEPIRIGGWAFRGLLELPAEWD